MHRSRHVLLVAVALLAALAGSGEARAAGGPPPGDPGEVVQLPPSYAEQPPGPFGRVPLPGPARVSPATPSLPTGRPQDRLVRAISDGAAFSHPRLAGVSQQAIERTAQTGAGVVRFSLNWGSAENGAALPADPTDSTDPQYVAAIFHRLDERLRLAQRNGLEPLVTVFGAPARRQGPSLWEFAPAGSGAPDAAAFGRFATAAARRYSGGFPDPLNPGQTLPRVRYWQAWNEPNLPKYLSPQWVARRGVWEAWAPAHYRRMLNAFGDGVKAVHADNLVVTAGTAPDGDPRDGVTRMTPLRFWQAVLCLGAPPRLTLARCDDPARFDVLAYHPLSVDDPDKPAPDLGVGIRDLGKLRAMLVLARRTGRLVAPVGARVWATELNWDSRPPDTGGATGVELRRWIPRALYLLWRQNVDLVAWQFLRDRPSLPEHPAGLYSVNPGLPNDLSADRAKPALASFRFPLHLRRVDERTVEVWALLPAPGPRFATLKRRTPRGWAYVQRVPVNASGMVNAVVPLRVAARMRLVVHGQPPSPAASVGLRPREPGREEPR